jgi:hypothetical protein
MVNIIIGDKNSKNSNDRRQLLLGGYSFVQRKKVF